MGKFKVGDRVRVEGHPYYIDYEAVIEKAGRPYHGVVTGLADSGRRGKWVVRVEINNEEFSFHESEMTLLDAKPIPPTTGSGAQLPTDKLSRERVWLDAYCAAEKGGKTFPDATADHALREFDKRFNKGASNG